METIAVESNIHPDTELYEIFYMSKAPRESKPKKIHGYMFRRKDVSNSSKAIIYCRGGNNFKSSAGSMEFKTKRLNNAYFLNRALEGITIYITNLRGSIKSEGKDEFGGKDIWDVISLFKLANELHPEIFLMGISRGGYQILNSLRLWPKKLALPKAVILLSASLNMAWLYKNKGFRPSMIEYRKKNLNWAKPADFRERDPINFIEDIARVPMLIVHGMSDTKVSYYSILEFVEKCNRIGYPYQFITINSDHAIVHPNDLIVDSSIQYIINNYGSYTID